MNEQSAFVVVWTEGSYSDQTWGASAVFTGPTAEADAQACLATIEALAASRAVEHAAWSSRMAAEIPQHVWSHGPDRKEKYAEWFKNVWAPWHELNPEPQQIDYGDRSWSIDELPLNRLPSWMK